MTWDKCKAELFGRWRWRILAIVLLLVCGTLFFKKPWEAFVGYAICVMIGAWPVKPVQSKTRK